MSLLDLFLEKVATRYLLVTAEGESSPESVLELRKKVDVFFRNLQVAMADILNYVKGVNPVISFRANDFVRIYNPYPQTLQALATAVLQTYVLTPAQRKGMEFLVKKTQTRFRLKWGYSYPLDRKLALKDTKVVFEFYEALQAVDEAIASGKLLQVVEHGTGTGTTSLRVGGFTLINAGGFSANEMKETADTMAIVHKLLVGSGLSKVCYGRVQITRSIGRNHNVLAFYTRGTDDLFVRGKTRSGKATVRTILHELGHRYGFKFLSGKASEIKRLYYQMEATTPDKQAWKLPTVGETVAVAGGEKATVVEVTEGGKKVKYVIEGSDPPIPRTISLDQWWNYVDPEVKMRAHPVLPGFVSNYAKKSPDENFAEMFSFYCMGDLPVNLSGDFEALLFDLPVDLNPPPG